MKRTEEKSKLLSDLFDIKAKMQHEGNDAKAYEKYKSQLDAIRERLVELEMEELIEGKEPEEEERKLGNGQF